MAQEPVLTVPPYWKDRIRWNKTDRNMDIHLRFALPAHLAFDLERALEALTGVQMAKVQRYEIEIERAAAFTWEEVVPLVGAAVSEFGLENQDALEKL